MLRRARNISRKFGIHNKEGHHSTSDYETSDEEHGKYQPLVKPIDTSGSKKIDSPLPSNDLKLQSPETNGLMLTHYKTAPDDLSGQQGNTNSLTTVLTEPPAMQPGIPSPRPTHITFALPVTPQRSKSPSAIAYPKARPIRSLSDDEMSINQARYTPRRPRRLGWRLFHDRDDSDDKPMHHHLPIFVGTRVRLKLRPLPTFGNVKYIGAVHFAPGEHIGVELDFGVGTCDGSWKGKRYFTADGKRGIFLQRNELEVVTADTKYK